LRWLGSLIILSHLPGIFKALSPFSALAPVMHQVAPGHRQRLAWSISEIETGYFGQEQTSSIEARAQARTSEPCLEGPDMYYALGAISHTHVSRVVVLVAVVMVMAFWRQAIKAIIALLVAAVTIGFAAGIFVLLHG
jgi:hypothetical protein